MLLDPCELNVYYLLRSAPPDFMSKPRNFDELKLCLSELVDMATESLRLVVAAVTLVSCKGTCLDLP